MRGLAQRAPSHCLHIPDCNQHAVHGTHSLQAKEWMLTIIGAPWLGVFPDPPGGSEVDLHPREPWSQGSSCRGESCGIPQLIEDCKGPGCSQWAQELFSARPGESLQMPPWRWTILGGWYSGPSPSSGLVNWAMRSSARIRSTCLTTPVL